mmetsp:Transcript_10705/g.30199  ORF Transcript_10705/g.30199 Transcript_10705/m.30199 type:complete len:854 (+) Transcript_10705:3-2564(+)
MGGSCCRGESASAELKRERWSEEVVRSLQEERRRKVHLLEEQTFVVLQSHAAAPPSKDDDQALFVEALEQLEKGDECESNRVGGSESDSDTDSTANAGQNGCLDRDLEEDYQVPNDLEDEPPLADWELVAAWNQLRRCKLPKPNVATRLIKGVTLLYSKSSALVHVESPSQGGRIIIVGDLHGHFGDLLHILDSFGEPCAGAGGTQYLFNGDFVDRGSWGPEVLLTLYCLKLRFPQAVHFNRGNHEDIKQNKMAANGFRDAHCTRAFLKEGAAMYALCKRSFGQLPLCHVLGGEIAVLHGGLPLDADLKLEEIGAVRRQRGVPTQEYCVHGYRSQQLVRARRTLSGEDGVAIKKGSVGRLMSRYKKTDTAVAFFGECAAAEAKVRIRGAPEAEPDVEIVFASEQDRLQQRSDRLFIALLWSDPLPDDAEQLSGPNGKRGAGYLFDRRVTEAFLQTNNLRCLVRSHEKQQEGSGVVQRDDGGNLLAVTVFSASNYPSGAGEPAGNKAGVLMVEAVQTQDEQSLALTSSSSWREPFQEMQRWTGPSVHQGFNELAKQAATKDAGSARQQVLEQLWLLIFCARPALLSYFNSIDREMQGKASLAEWVSAMRACVVPDEDFPWERLAPHLAHFGGEGRCHYGAFLRRFQNVLSRRLEARFCGATMTRALRSLGGGGAEQEWAAIDRDGNGKVTYEEFRPLLRAHAGCYTGNGAQADDDQAYALLASMDRDLSGFVEREEFMQALRKRAEQAPQAEEEAETLERCWAALHEVLRTLAWSRFQVDAIFRAMDTGRDGWLNRGEFRSGVELLLHGSALLPSSRDWEPLLWRLVDEDSSGQVSPGELVEALSVVDVTQASR